MHKHELTDINNNTRRRMFADLRFRAYGILGLMIAGSALLFLLGNIFSTGYDAFRQTVITMEFNLDADALDANRKSSVEELQEANTLKVAKKSLYALFPEVSKRKDKRDLHKLMSHGVEQVIREQIVLNPESIGLVVNLTVPMSSDVDQFYKARLSGEEFKSRLNKKQKAWLQTLIDNEQITTRFNSDFFSHADSRYPELAGRGGAVVGTLYTLIICLLR